MPRNVEEAPTAEALVSTTFGKNDALLTVQRGVLGAVLIAAAFGVGFGLVDRFSLFRATLYACAALVLIACSVLRAVWQGRLVIPRSWAYAPVAAFLGVLFVSAVLGSQPVRGFVGPYTRYTGVAMYCTYALLFAFVLRCHSTTTVRQIPNVMAWVVGLAATYGLMQFTGLDPINWPEEEAGSEFALATEFATFGNINFASGFVGTLAPCAAWVSVSRERNSRQRAAGAAAFGAATLYLLLLGSAQGLLALALGTGALAVAVALDRRDAWAGASKRTKAVLTGAAAVLALGAAPVLRNVAANQFNDAGTLERRQLWTTAFDLWQEQPILGFGPGSFERLFTANRPEAHAIRNNFLQADSPHNVLLDLAVSGGALLVVSYLAFVVLTGVALVRGLRRSDGERRLLLGAIGAAWLGYHGQSLVSIDVPSVGVLHWILAGAILVVARPPTATELRISAQPPRAKRTAGLRRRNGSRRAQPTGSWRSIAVVAVACIVLIWSIARPMRADRSSMLAAQALNVGDQEAGLAHASRAVELAPWEARYWAQEASAYDRIGRLDEARASGQQAASRAPGSSLYALAVAGLAVRMDDAQAASRWLDEALRRDPHNPDVIVAVEQTRELLEQQ